jgi:cytochrome P450
MKLQTTFSACPIRAGCTCWAIVRYDDIWRISRRLVSSAFTPRQVARIEDGIRVNAKRIIAEAATTGGGEFVDLIAKRLPLQTISSMLGVPEADRERVMEAADTLIAAGEVDGDRLTHAEIAAFLVLLSVAGNDTSRHTTSHAMRALTLNPGQRKLLLEDLDVRLPEAVEELVPWASPVMRFRRTMTCEVELYGETLPLGEKVVLFYHSGNRDERVFERPWEFDVTRSPNRHLGFGGGGPHYCMGASLARTQLNAIFGEMLHVMPDIEAGEPELLRSAFIHGIKRRMDLDRAREMREYCDQKGVARRVSSRFTQQQPAI